MLYRSDTATSCAASDRSHVRVYGVCEKNNTKHRHRSLFRFCSTHNAAYYTLVGQISVGPPITNNSLQSWRDCANAANAGSGSAFLQLRRRATTLYCKTTMSAYDATPMPIARLRLTLPKLAVIGRRVRARAH